MLLVLQLSSGEESGEVDEELDGDEERLLLPMLDGALLSFSSFSAAWCADDDEEDEREDSDVDEMVDEAERESELVVSMLDEMMLLLVVVALPACCCTFSMN